MVNRQITRRVLVSAVIAFFFVFILFVQPQGPPSPAIRAPGHIDKSKSAPATGLVKDDLLKGEAVMPRLGNETVKAELGRATWKYFHTMLARYPEHPTGEQRETLHSFIYLFSRLYPCGECATHFQQHLQKYPPQVSSRNAAAGWGCFIHNEVNAMLDKPTFDCTKIGDFYDCGCAEDEEEEAAQGVKAGEGEKQSERKETKGQSEANHHQTSHHTDDDGGIPPVEISKEETTQG